MNETHPESLRGLKDRPFYAIAEYMKNAGIGIIYAVPAGEINFERLLNRNYTAPNWHIFFYENEKPVKKGPADDFFNV